MPSAEQRLEALTRNVGSECRNSLQPLRENADFLSEHKIITTLLKATYIFRLYTWHIKCLSLIAGR